MVHFPCRMVFYGEDGTIQGLLSWRSSHMSVAEFWLPPYRWISFYKDYCRQGRSAAGVLRAGDERGDCRYRGNGRSGETGGSTVCLSCIY